MNLSNEQLIKCPECDHENRAALFYCERCQRNLHAPFSKKLPSPRIPTKPQAAPADSPVPQPAPRELMIPTLASVILGLVLGWMSADFTLHGMEAGPFIFFAASVVNPILVCLVARGYWTLIGIIPNLTMLVVCHAKNYQYKHQYEGMTLSAFLHSPQIAGNWGWFIAFLLLSLFVSSAMHGARTFTRKDFFDPSKT